GYYGGTTNTYDTGGKYNPSTDAWTSTSTYNVPSARYSHAAVWTGSEMIVWGGIRWNAAAEYSISRTLGRYRPDTDSWTTSGSSSPPGGRGRSAVWSGTEMVVWGGEDFFNNGFITGGRYNPTLDNWTATSTTNTPEVRTDHTAIWT